MQEVLDAADDSKARLTAAAEATAPLLQAEQELTTGRDLPDLHAALQATEAHTASTKQNAVRYTHVASPCLQAPPPTLWPSRSFNRLHSHLRGIWDHAYLCCHLHLLPGLLQAV